MAGENGGTKKVRTPFATQFHDGVQPGGDREQAISALGPSSATKPAEVRIVSAEFKYAPAKVRVAAGRAVTLVLDNSGAETEHGLFLPAFGFRLRATKGSARIPQLGGSRKQPPLARKPARIQAQIQRNTGGDPCVGRGSHFMTQHRVL